LPPTELVNGQPGTDDSFSHDAGLNELIRDDSDAGRQTTKLEQTKMHNFFTVFCQSYLNHFTCIN